MENGEIVICGLWEQDLVEQGLIEKGRCRTCFYNDSRYDRDNRIVWVCSKKGRLEKEQTDCKDWFVDTR